ncbi:MAG: flagellar biosynthesis protein FlhB [Lachnospiraceae bacterium]|nr:flagellar biosynthesis protein FlhB [Lachnospiraceae bacterium]
MTQAQLLQLNLQFFADDGGADKTEEPTSKKLEDARKEGQVAKSQEISNAFGLFALFLMIRFYVGTMGEEFLEMFNHVYNEIPETIKMYDGDIPVRAIESMLGLMLTRILLWTLPFLIAGFVIAFLTNLLQVGWKVTTKPMQPKLSKLSPAKGIKKIFSVRSLFELGKSLLKIIFIVGTVYFYLLSQQESIFLLYDIPLFQGIQMLGNLVVNMGLRVAAVYLILAIIDLIYQRREFHKDMMMTKQEVKDEFKEAEGDPQIKSKQRQRMQEASRRRMMQELPKADVVITNPTHYACAIRYDQGVDEAPVLIAKGADLIAQRIKEIAKENEIEIVENKPLARMLYTNVELGQQIPPELYQAVAEVLAYVYHLQGRL